MSRTGNSQWARLVDRCRDGDEEAWRRVVELITPLVFSICNRMKLSREETFDVFGQVCYQLLRNLEKLRSADKLLAYVGTMTRREVYALERKGRFFSEFTGPGANDIADTTQVPPDRMLELGQRSERLMKAMARLPQRDYELLRLLFLERDRPSYEEIARRLGMPVSSIGPTRSRSLAKLKRLLRIMDRDLGIK
ncbi:MAG: sigma-70 family RNA polymerase sigma factor [Candidatus Zixiibacteriota bacterium]|nr:MAG: sigma-70 family RNA polymerase sigma factor [candidate division Zixibacteria bacterium]